MTAPDPIRVLVVDDHAVVRRGVVAYLEALEDVAVPARPATGRRRWTCWPGPPRTGNCPTSC